MGLKEGVVNTILYSQGGDYTRALEKLSSPCVWGGGGGGRGGIVDTNDWCITIAPEVSITNFCSYK